MDTNQIAEIILALRNSSPTTIYPMTQPTTMMSPGIIITGMIIAQVPGWIVSIAGLIKSASAANDSKEAKTAVTEIHAAVNSERTLMVETIKQKDARILELEKVRSALEEKHREQEKKDAVAVAKVEVIETKKI